jgi:voltage-gated potassium channel
VKKLFQDRHLAGLLYAAGLLLLIHVIGTLGYWYIGYPKASWIDSFYMTFITVATIGYGEVVDLSQHPMGRLFTVFIGVFGIATLSYLFSATVAFLVDTDLNAAMRRRRMDKDISRLRDHYIICGIGRVGSNVALELIQTHRSFVVIESNREALDAWLEHHPDTPYLHEDAADDEALARAGLVHCAGVFAVTGDDSHNLMVAMSVKLLQPKVRVVVRLLDVRNEKKARRAGADEIVSPDFTGGMRIASAMVRPHVVNFMDKMLISEDAMRVEEVQVPTHCPPTPLGRLLPRSRDYVLLATHEHGRWLFNPEDTHMVQPGAVLVLMTRPEGRVQVKALVEQAMPMPTHGAS